MSWFTITMGSFYISGFLASIYALHLGDERNTVVTMCDSRGC